MCSALGVRTMSGLRVGRFSIGIVGALRSPSLLSPNDSVSPSEHRPSTVQGPGAPWEGESPPPRVSDHRQAVGGREPDPTTRGEWTKGLQKKNK